MDKHVLYLCVKQFHVIWCDFDFGSYLNFLRCKVIFFISQIGHVVFWLVCYVGFFLLLFLHLREMQAMFCCFLHFLTNTFQLFIINGTDECFVNYSFSLWHYNFLRSCVVYLLFYSDCSWKPVELLLFSAFSNQYFSVIYHKWRTWIFCKLQFFSLTS